jgi:hypothetical protein
MKATFALLANTEIHNLVRKLTWEAHQKYRTGTIDCRLPPHISLKQPFHKDRDQSNYALIDASLNTIYPVRVPL